ncbi:hypothetical protein TNCV_2569681 [Trichonephila clavipes]|nr:hypothetical protein TNCV_2569681 [Trichonephila clavipes]
MVEDASKSKRRVIGIVGKGSRERSHGAAWSPPFAVTNWKGGVRPSGCQRVRQKRESKTIRGASAFIPRRLAPVFWSGFFTVTQSLCLIGLESAEGYPLTVNDIPKRGKF